MRNRATVARSPDDDFEFQFALFLFFFWHTYMRVSLIFSC
jgi:hypothetical protein